jgi:hypothetical protein
MPLSDEEIVDVYLHLFTFVLLEIATPLLHPKSGPFLGPVGSLTLLRPHLKLKL